MFFQTMYNVVDSILGRSDFHDSHLRDFRVGRTWIELSGFLADHRNWRWIVTRLIGIDLKRASAPAIRISNKRYVTQALSVAIIVSVILSVAGDLAS